MARLTHALDEIFERLMESLAQARNDSSFDLDLDSFLLHVEDRFGKDISTTYFDWYGDSE